jgi:hypothetical protein
VNQRSRILPISPLALPLLWLLSSCSILGPGDPEEIRITNRTDVAIHVQVWELQASYIVDPAPSFALDGSREGVLLHDETLSLQPEDVNGPYAAGKDLAIFLFEVQGDTAFFRTVQHVAWKEIRDGNGRVLIQGF